MRSPARAIAWEFRQRHRWGWIALAGYVLVLVMIRFTVVALGLPVTLNSAARFAMLVVVPITATFFYLLAIFTYGLAGDVAARQSMYPARMFALPVTNAALAGWPMLYGTAAMALLWLITRLFALWPSTFDVPVIWPGLMAMVLLAWTQALTWMPYPLTGLRVIVTVLWLMAIDAAVMVALELEAREPVMLALLAPHLPLAYLAGRVAVARGRRGDSPDWRGAVAWLARAARVLPGGRQHFSSPAEAQTWFEWRRHGRVLPAMVAIVLPFELFLLFVLRETPVLVFDTLAGMLLTPPLMAGFVAASVSQSTLFTATRPLTSASLVAATLKAATWSTGAAWLLVVIAIPLAIALSDTSALVIERARWFREGVGTSRALVIALLGGSGLMVWTWRRLVQNLYIGLTGREWLIKGSVFFTLLLLGAVGPLLHFIGSDRVLAVLWDAAAWMLAVLVIVKISAAAWMMTRLARRRLLSDRALVIGAACWSSVVFALYGVLVWLLDTPFFPHYFLALGAILAVPLTRLAAAPLALAWNRHR